MDHSREVLKSHSEIYKVYGFLVQGETQYLGPCCSNVEQQEITIKRIRRSNCVTYWIQIYPGESVSPGGVSQLFEHTAPKSLSSEDLPWATRIGEYNTRPSLHHRESLQPSLSFGSSYNPTQRSWDRKVCVRGLGIQGDYGSMVQIAGMSYFVHTNQEDWVCQKKSGVAFCDK